MYFIHEQEVQGSSFYFIHEQKDREQSVFRTLQVTAFSPQGKLSNPHCGRLLPHVGGGATARQVSVGDNQAHGALGADSKSLHIIVINSFKLVNVKSLVTHNKLCQITLN